MIRGAPMVLLRPDWPFSYHDQDRGFPRKHPRSCSMGRCAAHTQLQKNLTPRRQGTKKNWEGLGPDQQLRLENAWSEAAENRYSCFPFLFAPWRLGVRSSVLGKRCSAQPVHDRFANTNLGHGLNIDSLQRQLVEFSKQGKKSGSRLGQIAILAQ